MHHAIFLGADEDYLRGVVDGLIRGGGRLNRGAVGGLGGLEYGSRSTILPHSKRAPARTSSVDGFEAISGQEVSAARPEREEIVRRQRPLHLPGSGRRRLRPGYGVEELPCSDPVGRSCCRHLLVGGLGSGGDQSQMDRRGSCDAWEFPRAGPAAAPRQQPPGDGCRPPPMSAAPGGFRAACRAARSSLFLLSVDSPRGRRYNRTHEPRAASRQRSE